MMLRFLILTKQKSKINGINGQQIFAFKLNKHDQTHQVFILSKNPQKKFPLTLIQR